MQVKHLKWLILSLALLKIAFHLYFYDMLEPHRDELLYFSLGTHPAGGYASVPPMIGILAFLLMKTIGFSAFAIKILPAIIGGVMVWLTAKITEELGGKWFAQLLAASGIFIAPVFVRPFYLYQPVGFDIFFWTLLFFFTIRFLNTRNNNYLLYLGIAAGFAILNKHLVVLQLGSLVIAFLLSSERKVLAQKSFWFATGLCIIIASPNIIWQLSHGLSGVRHFNALNKYQLVYLSRINFLKEQLLMPGSYMLITCAGVLALLFAQKLSKYSLLGITILLIITVLFIVKGKGYYTAGVFPLSLAAGAVWWEDLLKQWYFRVALMGVLLTLSIFLLPIGVPVYKPEKLAAHFKNFSEKYGMDGMLRHEDGKIHSLPQDYADMIGWEELARITATAYNQVPDKSHVLIYAENYGQASAINILGKKYGLPEPVSFSDNYYYWAPRKIPATTDTFIYINDELGDDIHKLFADVQLAGKISDPLAREYGTQVYLCRNPRTNFSEFWYKRVAGLESPF
ncbi:glycosyltransferase family 39 protein [Emticicia sp. BO119]|uniref:glycosyltransferase family 39 protein n=1 Tax=Emticicia sp. BO119 TaxID=2757768 RepID=UPI0015F07FD8|nr:glycosyltransferase family 39 protein [Emticicia sp. BO119]MBA4852176.1 glycosyltransferase family 39 protein [Emticicia sp. BO119]